MDDTQDKVRRNLVVFSAAIVIGWFLDLKLADIAKMLVSTNITNVNAGRLWIVILAVLIYLILRYRFDNYTDSQIASLFSEMKAQRNNYLFKYLLRKINRINQTGKFSPIFNTSLAETVNRGNEELEKQHSQSISFRLHIFNPWGDESPDDLNRPNTMWEGTIGVSEEYLREGSSHSLVTSSGQRHDFSILLSGRAWIKTHSFIHVVSYSKSAGDLIVPKILASLAFLAATCKLIVIYSS
jgi:hypothetical protein